jgi:hypothetical protein
MDTAYEPTRFPQLRDELQVVQLGLPGRRQRLSCEESTLPFLVTGHVVVLQRLKATG